MFTNFYNFIFIVLAVVTLVNADSKCYPDSCKGEQQTLCKYPSTRPASKCGKIVSTTLTEEEKQDIIDAHNEYRQRVASGAESRGKPGPQPAGNIPDVQWDEKLAELALRWALQCEEDHDLCRNTQTQRIGQNKAMKKWSSGYKTGVKPLVQQWYDEVDKFSNRKVDKYEGKDSSPGTGHYTQLVWGETQRVGCGLIRHDVGGMHQMNLICNYDPTGNMRDHPVYERY